MINIKNISFSFHSIPVLENVSFTIDRGEFIVVLGPNGAGKTTLLKLLLGILTPTSGTVTLTKQEKIGYVPQKIEIGNIFPGTVREIVKKTKVCTELGIENLLDVQFNKLSGGQKQRVLVALALEDRPSLLLLDEPTVGMDSKARKEFYELLKHLNKDHDLTILLVTHDLTQVTAHANAFLYVDDKNVQKRKINQLAEYIHA